MDLFHGGLVDSRKKSGVGTLIILESSLDTSNSSIRNGDDGEKDEKGELVVEHGASKLC